MTDLMPARGAKRNEKIAELLGWKNMHYSHGTQYGHAPGSVFITAIPDFCGDDAACFGLLSTLLIIPHFSVSLFYLSGFGVTVTDSFNRFDSRPSEPSSDGLRDAITQAAWIALTAANKGTE